MADEIARLGVAVDSSSAVSAERDINSLAAAGDRATASAKKLGSAWEAAKFSPSQLYSANRALAEFRQKATEASSATTQVDDSWKKATFSPSQLYTLNKALNTYKSELNQARAASDAVSKANAVQAASHHQVAKAAVGYTKSAKELAFATRNLPAQFTDIAVSLQAGQNPLTVLLQQGGQLKDMFGGVGNATRALAGYVKGLINVWSLGAVAIAAVTAAYIKGDAEARKLQATLTMQGNVLGVTNSDLIAASENMERFGQTQGAAAAALNTTAASGKIFGNSIQTVAQAALNLEREGGQAIEKTVQEFASLADDPVAAAVKLDEQYKFLTVSTYDQIRALEEQGDTMGAAQVAMDALAHTINERTKDVNENLGLLENAWRGVAGAAKWAWDQMLNIGRQESVQDQMSDLVDRLQAAQDELTHFKPGSDQANFIQKRITELRQDYAKLSDQYVEGEKKAAQQQREEQGRQAAISLAEEAKRGATNAEKRVIERAKIEATATRAIEGIVAKNSQDRIAQETAIRENEQKAIAAMEKRLADPKAPKSQATKDAEKLLRDRARDYENLDQALDRHADTLSAAGDAQDKLSAFEKFAIKTISDLDNGHTALDLAQRQEIKTRIEALRVIDQENQSREKQQKVMEVSANLHARIAQELAQQGQAHNRELLGIGRGQNEGALEQALEEIRIRSVEERTKLEQKYQDLKAVGSAQYLSDLQAINDAEARLSANEVAQMARRREAMGDWRNGARSAMEDIAWEMGDVAGRTRDSFITAFGAMNSALTTFSNTGKVKIRDFATTVIAELLRIALTIAANKILMSFIGGLGGGVSSTADLGGSTYGMSNTYPGGVVAANGAVFNRGNLTSYARGGLPFGGLGGVRTSPTLFSMANGGTGLMAEQNPEAVMPLARGPNGKLGVIAQGGGGTVMNVTTNVNVYSDGRTTSSTRTDKDDAADGKKLSALIDMKVREVLNDERRQGGTLWAMQNGR